jgi:hypothetical protein
MYTVDKGTKSLPVRLLHNQKLWKKGWSYPQFIHTNPQAFEVIHINSQSIHNQYTPYTIT